MEDKLLSDLNNVMKRKLYQLKIFIKNYRGKIGFTAC